MIIPTPGQMEIANAVVSRFEAGDSDERVLADLLMVVAAVISDIPDTRRRLLAIELASAMLPEVVTSLVRRQEAA